MNLLLVEDDPSVARFLARGLREEGYTVDLCADGLEALDLASRAHYDLLVCDWGVPGLDGVSLIRALRERGVMAPALVLTARDGTDPTVLALNAGADDFMSKPFSFEELVARLRALARRSAGASASRQIVPLGPGELDLRQRVLRAPGAPDQELSNREFALLELLIKHRGETLSRARILDRVWGMSHDPSTNVVDVYIGYLRVKLSAMLAPDAVAAEDSLIETVRGRGYRLREES